MIDELHKLLETHSHLRGFPQFKRLRAWVEERLATLEGNLTPNAEPPKAIPAEPEVEIERRI